MGGGVGGSLCTDSASTIATHETFDAAESTSLFGSLSVKTVRKLQQPQMGASFVQLAGADVMLLTSEARINYVHVHG